MKKSRGVLCGLLALAVLLGTVVTASAGSGPGYGVSPLLPENQIDAKVPYFYIDIEPDHEQTLQVQIVNRYDYDIVLSVEAFTAFSAGSGMIAYAASDERDPSLKIDFSSIASVAEPIITLPANEQAIAEITVKMPVEPLEGEMLGGIRITKLPNGVTGDATQREKKAEGTAIQSLYAYAIAVRIRQDDAVILPDFEVLGSELGVLSSFPTFELAIRNPKPLIVKGFALDVTVQSGETGETVMHFTADNLDIAPNSVMPYTKYLRTEEVLAPGNYQVLSTITFDELEWDFKTPLTVLSAK